MPQCNRGMESSRRGAWRGLEWLAVAVAAGVLMTYAAYFVGSRGAVALGSAGSVVVWAGVLYAVYSGPLRGVLSRTARSLSDGVGVFTFFGYLSVHLLLYGFIVEAFLAAAFGLPVIHTAEAFLNYTLVPGATPYSMFLDITIDPTFTLVAPPFLEASLPLYSWSMALIVASLVSVNIAVVRRLGRACTRGRKRATYYGLPLLGAAGGASCCLSIPLLLAAVSPAAGAVVAAYKAAYIAYYLFPGATAYGLLLNYRATEKIERRIVSQLEHSVSGGQSAGVLE